MFSLYYESCLENISLVRLSPFSKSEVAKSETTNKSSDAASINNTIVTLGDVVRASRYVSFCLFRSSSSYSPSFLNSVRMVIAQRNTIARKNSGNGSPARLKKLFGLKRKKKASVTAEVTVVVVDLEPGANDFNLCQITEPGFYFLPDSQQYATKSRLLRALNFSGAAPAFIIVDASDLSICTLQGRRMLSEDPNGEQFPWTDPPITEVFKGKYLRNVNESDGGLKGKIEYEDFSSFKPCVKGLYFGAKWCPPCRAISKQLISMYDRIKAKHSDFEIFFCSSDRSEESFLEHFSTMPWLAFPFGNEKLTQLTRVFDINGIPAFILLDEENNIISRHGRSVLMSDPTCKLFPWKRQPIYELNEFTVHRIADFPSLILFTEGTPEDNEFSLQILKPVADVLLGQLPKVTSFPSRKESNSFSESCISTASTAITSAPASQQQSLPSNNSDSANEDHNSVDSMESIPPWTDPFQVFYTGEDPICDFILESIGQGQADLPLLVICDVMAGHMAICDKPDVSDIIVSEFVADYRKGRANVMQLPSIIAPENKRVGGIPVNLIEQIMINQQNHQNQNDATSPAVSTSSA